MQVNSNPVDALVLFSGPGGSSLGLRQAGVRNTLGIEYDPSFKGTGVQPAVATARAAGLDTMQEDVREVVPQRALDALCGHGRADLLLQASPPCQGLSAAGKGAGREDLELLLQALRLVAQLPIAQAAAWTRWYTQQLAERCSDDRSPLTFEVVRWIAGLNPEYVMLEQVPAALPIWQAIGEVLRGWGYSVWADNVQAERFGVPQTRKRAILMASRVSEVEAPVPTHSKYHNRTPSKLDPGVAKWASMAEALGWGRVAGVMVSNYGSGGDPANRGERTLAQPAPTVTSKIGRNKIHFAPEEITYRAGNQNNACERRGDQPAPTVAFGHNAAAHTWQPTHMGDVASSKGCIRSIDEPAPTMTASMDNGNFKFIDAENPPEKALGRLAHMGRAGMAGAGPAAECTASQRPRPLGHPAHTITGKATAQFVDLETTPEGEARRATSVRVTVEEAGILQAFPADFPWQGSKTAQFQQVGNAVPPLLQQALTSSLLAHRDTWGQPVSQTA